MAGDSALADRVTFTGPVHGADKAALLAGAQLLVLPSYSENFGNVVLEAMAAGRPGGGDAGSRPRAGGRARPAPDSSPAADPTALSRAMATLLDDPALRLRDGRSEDERAVARAILLAGRGGADGIAL